MRRLVILLLGLIFLSCEREIIIVGDDEKAEVEIANVEISFDFSNLVITVYNGNKSRAYVEISRYNNDVHTYLKIFEESINGFASISRNSDFQIGDEIRIKIKIEQSEITRYYLLGG
jgi:hypothetical protein